MKITSILAFLAALSVTSAAALPEVAVSCMLNPLFSRLIQVCRGVLLPSPPGSVTQRQKPPSLPGSETLNLQSPHGFATQKLKPLSLPGSETQRPKLLNPPGYETLNLLSLPGSVVLRHPSPPGFVARKRKLLNLPGFAKSSRCQFLLRSAIQS